jgi:hypothetical protein
MKFSFSVQTGIFASVYVATLRGGLYPGRGTALSTKAQKLVVARKSREKKEAAPCGLILNVSVKTCAYHNNVFHGVRKEL